MECHFSVAELGVVVLKASNPWDTMVTRLYATVIVVTCPPHLFLKEVFIPTHSRNPRTISSCTFPKIAHWGSSTHQTKLHTHFLSSKGPPNISQAQVGSIPLSSYQGSPICWTQRTNKRNKPEHMGSGLRDWTRKLCIGCMGRHPRNPSTW